MGVKSKVESAHYSRSTVEDVQYSGGGKVGWRVLNIADAIISTMEDV